MNNNIFPYFVLQRSFIDKFLNTELYWNTLRPEFITKFKIIGFRDRIILFDE